MKPRLKNPQSSRFARVEKVSDGYYRFHMPAIADLRRVKEMSALFERTVQLANIQQPIENIGPFLPLPGK
jgi:hypothetical protein